MAAWDGADESLKTFAHMAVAAQVGCRWCLDVNLFQAHRNLLFTIAYEILGSAAGAEDVLQESWLRWAGVDRSRVREPRAYVIGVVTRQALNFLRTLSRRRDSTSANGCRNRC